MSFRAVVTGADFGILREHLFRADGDEHAAFLFCGLASTSEEARLLVRRVVPIEDADFVPSDRGAYRQITSRAVMRAAVACEREGLLFAWAHSHPLSTDRVGFSPDDVRAHAWAHPGLIGITGAPVASFVFGSDSVAGELWRTDRPVESLSALRVVGGRLRDLRPAPSQAADPAGRFARQAMMFGSSGQAVLRDMRVVVCGAGGGGSLLVQMLAHLGVGTIVVIDFDRVSESNLSRIVGSTPRDARAGRLKVEVMKRMVEAIDPSIAVLPIVGDITFADDARRIGDADFAFLATDTLYARYAFNAACNQFLVPGIQIGAKVTLNDFGNVDLIHVMERPVATGGACLECQGAIPAAALRREQLTPQERRQQAYLGGGSEDDAVEDPSVITLNSVAAALAATDFLLAATGLAEECSASDPLAYYPLERTLRRRSSDRTAGCRFCDPTTSRSLAARGDLVSLPLRQRPVSHRDAGLGLVRDVVSRLRMNLF